MVGLWTYRGSNSLTSGATAPQRARTWHGLTIPGHLSPLASRYRPVAPPDLDAASRPEGAERLFHGFSEGYPRLVVDRYATTLVVFDATATSLDRELWSVIRSWLAERRVELGSGAGVEIRSVLWKVRRGRAEERLGLWVQGGPEGSPREIVEDGVGYAVELRLQADASFYLDTRELRRWLRREAVDRSAQPAYTGSLGVAARAGSAARVVQLDRNPRFLAVAARSMAANGFPGGQGRPAAQRLLPRDRPSPSRGSALRLGDPGSALLLAVGAWWQPRAGRPAKGTERSALRRFGHWWLAKAGWWWSTTRSSCRVRRFCRRSRA